MNRNKEYVDRLLYIIAYLTDGHKKPLKNQNSDFYSLVAEMFFACVLPQEGPAKLAIRSRVKGWVFSAGWMGFPNLSELGSKINEDVHSLRLAFPDYIPRPADIGRIVTPDDVLERAEAFRERTPALAEHIKRDWKRVVRVRRV